MSFKDLFSFISVRDDVHYLTQIMFDRYLPKDAVVYDIGCGQKPFAATLKGRVAAHIGVDLADGFYSPDHVDLVGTAYSVPAPDGCADAVISSQVIEHLETPLIAIDETYRLLKAGGLFFLSFPFLYPIHAQPRDFLRYTEFYLKDEIAKDRYEILEIERIGGFWYLLGMYCKLYLQQLDRGLLKRLRIVAALIFIVSVVFKALHWLEGALFSLLKGDVKKFRMQWTVNYVCLLRKK